MKKNLKITIIFLLIISSLFCGCTQQNTNENGIYKEVKIISQNITTYGNPPSGFKEVTGQIKNIGNRTINATVVVTFYDKYNTVLYTGNYTIYNFISGIIENYVVEFWATEPNYKDYDHYSISLEYA